MPNYRRARVPGGCFFFTLVTHARKPLFHDERARRVLSRVLHRCQMERPFTINAIVLLPDHLHTIWTLPGGDLGYPSRWGWIKKEFTKAWTDLGGSEEDVSPGRKRERRRGVWQPRYWEHTLDDEADFERHFDYIHFNPVKHGLVPFPYQWPWSSFHRWVRTGVYPSDWACSSTETAAMNFRDIERTVGE